MIAIRSEYCDGCGACVEVCPTGALYLVDGKAAVEASLCRECGACIPACPTQAIASSEQQPESAAQPVYTLARRTEPAVIQVESAPLPVPLHARVLPAIGAALAWAGRAIVPRLADRFLDSLVRQLGEKQACATGGRTTLNRRQDAKRRQLRRRMRGGTGDR